jgi:type I restriction enzyme S subunit
MTSRGWTTVRLGNHCSKIGSGATPRGGESVYQESGVSFIRSQNVYNGFFAMEGLAYLAEEHAEHLKGVTVEPGDVLLNITGDSVARSCRVPDAVLPARVNQHVAIIRPTAGDFDPRFVGYFFISPFMQNTMLSLAGSGGTRKALTKEMIERFDVPRPPRPVQERIADILSAYDDLIENNRRRMALLEEAARQLYREWFVRLRFPGHEHTPITNGVPEGWERRRVEELVSLTIGGGWGGDDHSARFTEPAFVVRGTDLPDLKSGSFGRVPFRFHETKNLARRELHPGDIVLEISNGNIRNIGRSYRIEASVLEVFDGKVMCASFCRLLRPTEETESHLLASHLEEMQSNGRMDSFKTPSAAGINNFRFTALLEKENLVVPPRGMLQEFLSQVRTLRAQLATLAVQSHKLRTARDLLLPRLMSGEIAV